MEQWGRSVTFHEDRRECGTCCGKVLSPFTQRLLPCIQIPCLVLGPPVQDRYGQSGASSAEGLGDGWRLEHSPCGVTLRELVLFFLFILFFMNKVESHSQKHNSSPEALPSFPVPFLSPAMYVQVAPASPSRALLAAVTLSAAQNTSNSICCFLIAALSCLLTYMYICGCKGWSPMMWWLLVC